MSDCCNRKPATSRPALADLEHRALLGLLFTVPLVALAMGHDARPWLGLALATPVVFRAGAWLFAKALASVRSTSRPPS